MTIGLTIQDVRTHLRDDPDTNFLIGEEEFSEKQIKLAIDLTFQAFNEAPPILTGFNEGNLPEILRDVILVGVLSKIYRGKALEQERNRLAYSDGGINVNISDRAQFYLTVSQQFQADFEQRSARWKHWINLEQAYGGIGSDYSQFFDRFI